MKKIILISIISIFIFACDKKDDSFKDNNSITIDEIIGLYDGEVTYEGEWVRYTPEIKRKAGSDNEVVFNYFLSTGEPLNAIIRDTIIEIYEQTFDCFSISQGNGYIAYYNITISGEGKCWKNNIELDFISIKKDLESDSTSERIGHLKLWKRYQ